MKKLLLIALIFTTHAFAQEVEVEKEERQVEIRMEALGGGVEVAAGGASENIVSAFSDKSIWVVEDRGSRNSITYCWVDEDNEPHCKDVNPK